MGNDIEIRVKVDNQTGTGLAAANASLRTLRTSADSAGAGLRTLATRSAEGARSLRALESRAQSVTRALTQLGATGDIRLTARLDDGTRAGIASVKAGLRDLKRESPVLLKARLDNGTRAGISSVQTALRGLKRESPVMLRASFTGETGQIAATVRALRDLKRQSPVRIVSTFDGQAGQITAAARSMRDLRGGAREVGAALDGLSTRAAAAAAALNSLEQQAEDASRALRTLRGRAAAAAVAMGELRTSTTSAANSLRSFNTRTATANTRLGDLGDRTRSLRTDTDDLDGSMRRLTGTMGGLRGRIGTISTSSGDAGGGMEKLASGVLMLAPALLPVAASLVPIAAGAGAAGVAVGAFGAAVLGQLVAVKGATDAQQKYDDAVKQHGAASEQATAAEADYLAKVRQMDPATRKSAASLSVLKDTYKQWSTDLAGDTMPVVTKGFATFGALLPKLAPTVRATSTELNRLMTVLAGGVASGGFDKFMASFQEFSTGALSKATDGLVRFMRTMSGGTGSSQLSAFMDYARKVGPQVGETLGNLAKALVHLVASASDTGVSMLSLVNAFAKLVNAIPTGVLSTLLQFVVVFKAVKMAAAGLAAAGGLSTFAATIGTMRTAAAGATGPLASLGAAFGALSRTAKVALIGAGIGILVIALSRLSEIGKKAPPDVDKMTTALGKLGQTGQATGEAARVFGKDFEDLGGALRTLARPSNLDKFQQGLVSLIGMDSTPVKESKEAFDGLDKGLTSLVRGGKADLAAAALKNTISALKEQGFTSKEVTSQLDDYKAALADQALEQELAAQAQGLFGQAALDASTKLDAQKASADGLRGAIQALNDVQRQGLGGMIGFEAAIDAAAKAARDNHGALSMTNGVLNLGSEKARNAASALQDLASKTDSAASSARESGSSWETVNGIYERGRSSLIANAQAMGLNKTEAAALADQILKIPNRTARVKMNAEDAKHDIESFNAAVKKTPSAKSVTLKALSKSGEQVLESFGLKVKRLPDGSVTVSTKGNSLSAIRNIGAALRALNGRTARTWTIHTIRTNYVNSLAQRGQSVHDAVGATGGLYTGKAFRYADGGPVRGPGTGTSDDVPAPWLSNGEFVIKAAAVQKYGEKFLQRVNDGQFEGQGFAKGGKVKLTKSQQRAKAQAEAESQARHDARGDLTVSHFGRMAGYRRSEFGNALGKPDSVGSLVSALNGWRSTIMKSTHGSTENKLLKQLDSTGRKLLGYEKALTKVTASLDKAKDKLNDLKSSAASLSSSVKGGVLGSANITRGAGSDKTVTVGSIMGGLTQSRDKATAFASALKDLQKKGVDKALIQQIAEAGIEGGGLETAGALLGASSSEIKSMNQLQGQIGKAAGSAGKTTADAVYGAAIKAQTLVVKTLTKSQDSLKKSMDKLARSMEKAIEKAFKGKANGGIVGGAASGGLRGGLTWVGEEGPELVRLPASSTVYPAGQSRQMAGAAWASMLNEPRRPAAAAPGGGKQEVNVTLEFRSSGGSSRYEAFLLEEIQRMVRARGGNVQQVFSPPRGR